MKKLYHKGTVHPSPPAISDQLSFLPQAILTLAVALSPEDREVLAYLIFCSSANFSGNPRRSSKVETGGVDGDHAPQFNCSCFRCYTSYWVRWDESPNRQRIHEIIDAFEEWLAKKNNKKGNGKKEKRNNKKGSSKHSPESKRSELTSSSSKDSAESESVGDSNKNSGNIGGEDGDGVVAEEKGSVRKIVSFIGERIWGAWGQ